MAKSKRKRGSEVELADRPRRFPAFLAAPVRCELIEIAERAVLESRWEPGRQGTGYEKLDLRAAADAGALGERRAFVEGVLHGARVSFGETLVLWDAYFLRYRDGAFVPEHRDPTGASKHLRLNALLADGEPGTGQLRFFGDVFELGVGDAVLFRPDLIPHRVSRVSGQRLLLSVGGVVAEPS